MQPSAAYQAQGAPQWHNLHAIISNPDKTLSTDIHLLPFSQSQFFFTQYNYMCSPQ